MIEMFSIAAMHLARCGYAYPGHMCMPRRHQAGRNFYAEAPGPNNSTRAHGLVMDKKSLWKAADFELGGKSCGGFPPPFCFGDSAWRCLLSDIRTSLVPNNASRATSSSARDHRAIPSAGLRAFRIY
jgi:hypothetical protein